MPGFSTVSGGATAEEVWSFRRRTLTKYWRADEIVRNKDYDNATPDDLIFSIVAFAFGQVTADELASFIDYGVRYRNLGGVYASILQANPFNVWVYDLVADTFNSPNISITSIKTILASPHITGDVIQGILHAMADKGYFERLLEIITSGAPDESVTEDVTLWEGVNVYRSLSIASGATLTLGQGPGIIVADVVSNSGEIRSEWVLGAGGDVFTGAGSGGHGGGGVIILAREVEVGTIVADGRDGRDAGTLVYSGDGSSGLDGRFFVVDPDLPTRGGRGGCTFRGPNEGFNGGGGGGTGTCNLPGYGGSAMVTVFGSARELLAEVFKSVVDWWISNVLGKPLSSPKSLPYLGGGGGGAGSACYGVGIGGGGGGGGGQIIVFGSRVTGGVLSARGGRGGNGGNVGPYDGGGGGGGGGVIYVFYRTLAGSNTFHVEGGDGGTGDCNGEPGGAGIGREMRI